MSHTRKEVTVAGVTIGAFVLIDIDYPEMGPSCDCCSFSNEMGCNLRSSDTNSDWLDHCYSTLKIWQWEA